MMKKFLCLLIALIIPLFFMCGCSNTETEEPGKEPIKTQLTINNCSDYISFNLVYDEFVVYNESSYCIAKIKTFSAKNSVIFDNVEIEFKISHYNWRTYGPALNGDIIQAKLSYNGISESSMSLWNKDTVLAPPSSHISDITIISISGDVWEL